MQLVRIDLPAVTARPAGPGRRIVSAAVALGAAAVLAGCSGSGADSAAAKPEGFDVAAALKQADRSAYSAVMTTRSEADGKTALSLTGRINFNAPTTGSLRMSISPGTAQESGVEQVITDGAAYTRVTKGAGAGQAWQKVPVTDPAKAARVPDLARYAELLLERGPSVQKGQVTKDGVVTQHLSGEIGKDDLRTVDTSVYESVKNSDADGVRTDVWVDREGRIVRLEQWFSLREPGADKETALHQATRFSDFAGPVEVRTPKGA
ncbi:hypothetical protein [Streptomyces sp. NPDC060194]|uniref:hypothetical protein n=1 Tax=Streptomyces sp. NPDC060194 TaxID=3347069 RepID=UPI0036509B5B